MRSLRSHARTRAVDGVSRPIKRNGCVCRAQSHGAHARPALWAGERAPASPLRLQYGTLTAGLFAHARGGRCPRIMGHVQFIRTP